MRCEGGAGLLAVEGGQGYIVPTLQENSAVNPGSSGPPPLPGVFSSDADVD